jgi:hypothetical protein
MSIATSLQPTARPSARINPAKARRKAARLLLVIAARTYRFLPHVFDPGLDSEERYVFQGPDGRSFSVYEKNMDMDEAKALLIADRPIPRRYHCEACNVGHCDHVAALHELGML